MTGTEKFSGLSQAVGANLAARRQELGKSLRATAAEAEVSPSHLSDIEKGRSQVSIPVLLRLVQALDLTISDLLPRIGGNQAALGSIAYLDAPVSPISHPELELAIEHRRIAADETAEIANPTLGDLLIHVLDGDVSVTADGVTHLLSSGDTMDSERLPNARLTAHSPASILIVNGAEQS